MANGSISMAGAESIWRELYVERIVERGRPHMTTKQLRFLKTLTKQMRDHDKHFANTRFPFELPDAGDVAEAIEALLADREALVDIAEEKEGGTWHGHKNAASKKKQG